MVVVTARLAASQAARPPASSGDGWETGALEKACGDRGAVASRTINDEWTIGWERFYIFDKMIQGNGEAAGEVLQFPFARGANSGRRAAV